MEVVHTSCQRRASPVTVSKPETSRPIERRAIERDCSERGNACPETRTLCDGLHPVRTKCMGVFDDSGTLCWSCGNQRCAEFSASCESSVRATRKQTWKW